MNNIFICIFLCAFTVANLNARDDYARGFWGFIGLGLGGHMVGVDGMPVNPTNAGGRSAGLDNLIDGDFINPGSPEVDKLGFSAHVKGGLSWYLAKRFVLDAMIAYQFSQTNGPEPDTCNSPGPGGANACSTVGITHLTSWVDISPRFRFGETGRWQLGPVLKLHFGTDTDFSEREGQHPSVNDTPMTTYLGLHLNYDIPSTTRKTIYRVGLQGLMDMSSDRQIIQVLGMFEMGWCLFGCDPSNYAARVQEEEPMEEDFIDPEPLEMDLPEAPPPPMPEPAPLPPPPPQSFSSEAPSVAVVRGQCIIRFPAVAFNFRTNYSNLTQDRAVNYLRQLGGWLSSNDSLWGYATAVGHTDVRGGDVINVPLSNGRARTFKSHLQEGGASSGKISAEGRASSEPVDPSNNESAWRLNRRTELMFRDAECSAINQKVMELNSQYGF